MDIEKTLDILKKSKFRAKFKLSKEDKDYIDKKGIDVIKSHAMDFISKRLAPAQILNDGKQTPWKGHPIFIAQHACACCCRECLYKWHKIPKGIELDNKNKEEIVDLLMAWIERNR